MKKRILLGVFALLFLGACTENAQVKTFGGTGDVNLAKGEKLVNVTWKDNDLWILTKDMKQTDSAEVYKFSEKSSLGLLEGTYIIKETK